MTLTVGSHLGAYELLAPLDAGGLGEVHRARDTRSGREVAVWILDRDLSGDELLTAEQTARVAAMVDHPAILAVFEIARQDDTHYLVTEVLEGQTLRERLKRSSIPPRRATGYALQLARGLAAAHAKGVVHGRLRPENLFLTRGGPLKILNFASHGPQAPDGDAANARRGDYTAPEQLRGQPGDVRSDVFAVGAILYEMLSGKSAFARESSEATRRAISEEDPPDLIEAEVRVPPVLARIVAKCLAKNPADRFQSAGDLAFALESVSWPETVPPAILDESSGLYIPERRRLGTILAVFMLAAGMVVVTFAIGQRVGGRQNPGYEQVTFRRGAISAARFWSLPKGRGIVYSAAWNGAPVQIYELKPGTRESQAKGLNDTSLLAVSSRSGELFLGRNAKPDDSGALCGALARLPIDSASPQDLSESASWADWDPASSGLVIVSSANGRDRLRMPSGQLLYESPGRITHPRVSRQGDSVAFFEHPDRGSESGSVAVVNLKGQKRVLSADWAHLSGLAWSPRDDEVWFTGSQDGTSTSLNSATLSGRVRVLSRSPGRLVLHDVSHDGQLLVTRETVSREVLVMGPDMKRERSLGLFDAGRARDISADGQMVLFDDRDRDNPLSRAVYIRRGSAEPVRLGPGRALALSPDGRWALSVPTTGPPQLVLLPTESGQARNLATSALASYQWATFFPDGKRILFAGNQAGQAPRLYRQHLDSTAPEPLTPEGIAAGLLAPDGRTFVGFDLAGRAALYTLGSSEPRSIPGLEAGDVPIGWTADGQALLVTHSADVPAVISKLEVSTGKKSVWQEIQATDPAGVVRISDVHVTPDLKSYIYTCERVQSDLYVVEGLR